MQGLTRSTTVNGVKRTTGTLVLSLFALTACPTENADTPDKPTAAADDEGSASKPADGSAKKKDLWAARTADDKDYVADPEGFPQRLGLSRRFMRVSRTNHVRDPAFIPGTNDLLVVAKVGAIPGIWRMPIDGSRPATLVVPKPLFDKKGVTTARNRPDWYIGTPRVFPDGKHVIFEGSRNAPKEKWGHVLGVVGIEGGLIHAIEVEGTSSARTPDVHPDGETIVMASCTELRTARLSGFEDQKVESKTVVELPRLTPRSGHELCTVHRPRYSRDGKKIVFEVIGQYLSDEMKEKYNVPKPLNEGDYLIEPWIVNADGTGLRRLVSDEAYGVLAGRLQSGGSKEPDFSPDGRWVVFSHGHSIAMVSVDGKQASIVASSVVIGQESIQFTESDATFSPDGKYIAAASDLITREGEERMAPPGISIIDLAILDATVGGAASGAGEATP